MQPNLEKKIALVKTEQKKTGHEDKVLEIQRILQNYEQVNDVAGYTKLLLEHDQMIARLGDETKKDEIQLQELDNLLEALDKKDHEMALAYSKISHVHIGVNLKDFDSFSKSIQPYLSPFQSKWRNLSDLIIEFRSKYREFKYIKFNISEIENAAMDCELYSFEKHLELERDFYKIISNELECIKSQELNHIYQSLITQCNEAMHVKNNVANLIAAQNLKKDDEIYKPVYKHIEVISSKRKMSGKIIKKINLTYLEFLGRTSKRYWGILDCNQRLLEEFRDWEYTKSRIRTLKKIRGDRNRIKQGFENIGATFDMLSKLFGGTNKNVEDDFDMPLLIKNMSDTMKELSAMNNEADLQYEEAFGDIMDRSLALQQESNSYLREWSSKFQGCNKLSFEYELFLKQLSSNKRGEKNNVSIADLEQLKRYRNAFEASAKDVDSEITSSNSIISKHAPGWMLLAMEQLIFASMKQANPAEFVSPLDVCNIESTFYPKLIKRNYDESRLKYFEYSLIFLENIFILYEKSAYAFAYDQLIVDCNFILECLANQKIKNVSSAKDIEQVTSVRNSVKIHLDFINSMLIDIYAFIVNAENNVYHHFNMRLEKMYNARDKLKKIYHDLQTPPLIPLFVVQLFFASLIEYAVLLKSKAYPTDKSYPTNIIVYHPTSVTRKINECYVYFRLREDKDGSAYSKLFFNLVQTQEIFERIQKNGYLLQSDECMIGLSTILSAAEKDLNKLKIIRTKIVKMSIILKQEENIIRSLSSNISSYPSNTGPDKDWRELCDYGKKLNNAYYQANRGIAILSQQSKSIAKKTTEKLDSLPTSFPLITTSVSANNSKNSLAISAPLPGKSAVQVVVPPQSPPAFACKAQSEAITPVKPVTNISSFLYFKPSNIGENEYRFGLYDRNVEFVPGDCFFDASIACRPDKNWNKQQLRQSIHDELLNSRSAYEDIFVLRDKDGDYFIDFWDALLRKSKTIKFKTYEDYCRHVLVDKMSVDEVEISAFAKANDVCCVIVCKESGEVKIYQSLWAGDENPPIILGRINNNHYVALECPPQVTWQEIFKKMNAQSNVPALKGY